MRTLLAGMALFAGTAALAQTPEPWRDRERPVIDFEITRTRLFTRECDGCGSRRGEYGGLGVFRVETRRYQEVLRGHLVRTWREDVEVFDHCVRARIR
jgi:hypothetical protein